MSFREEFGPLLSGEIITLTFDFTGDLAFGETILSSSTVVTVYSGNDSNPNNILGGSATISGRTALQLVSTPSPGNIYLLTCAITTSLAHTFLKQGYLAVLPSGTTWSSNPPTVVAPTCGRFSVLVNLADPGSQWHFVSFAGNKISIDGYLYEIPAGNLAFSGGIQATFNDVSIDKVLHKTLSGNTTYRVYVYVLNGVLTLDFSQYYHATSVVDGVEIKIILGAEDRTCTLVGMIHTDATGRCAQGGGNNQPIASWFNRLTYPIFDLINGTVLVADYPTFKRLGGVSPVSHLEWVTWADYYANFQVAYNALGSNPGDNLDTCTSCDATNPTGIHGYYNVPNPANIGSVSYFMTVGNTFGPDFGGEGLVRIEIFARCSGAANIVVQDGLLMAFIEL